MSWITHRAPTKEDGDKDGYVVTPSSVLSGCWSVQHWDEVSKGHPFLPYPGPAAPGLGFCQTQLASDPGRSEEPETTAGRFKQITSHRDGALATAIDVDDNAWYLAALGGWYQYPPLPDRES